MDLRSFFRPENILPRSFQSKKSGVMRTPAAFVPGPVVTRIAPSPTGWLHIGTARTALFNYLYAKQHNGTFIVRIEDTDKERNRKEYEDDILDGLHWLGIEHDALYRQSEHRERHRVYLEELLKYDKAYLSKEPGKDDPNTQVEVVRLRNPGREIIFDDLIRGTVTVDTAELGDFVIARSVTDPLYHFAAVADDHDMKVTHVIRGEDHVSNTPRQILIQEALGFPRPQYAHLPLILNADRTKMSKRGEGSTVREYRESGYYPDAIVNYLALLGWNPGTDRERFTLDELIDEFDLTKIQKGGAVFDIEKLQWFNRQFLRTIPSKKLERSVAEALPASFKQNHESEHIIARMVPLLQEKIRTMSDIKHMVDEGELEYFFVRPSIEEDKLSRKGDVPKETIATHLKEVVTLLEQIPTPAFTADAVKRAVWDYATEKGRGEVLWPMRYALSAREKSPDPFVIAEILGKKETLERLGMVIARIAP